MLRFQLKYIRGRHLHLNIFYLLNYKTIIAIMSRFAFKYSCMFVHINTNHNLNIPLCPMRYPARQDKY